MLREIPLASTADLLRIYRWLLSRDNRSARDEGLLLDLADELIRRGVL
jgi:hypothetical protein